jgi:hypothetical protein
MLCMNDQFNINKLYPSTLQEYSFLLELQKLYHIPKNLHFKYGLMKDRTFILQLTNNCIIFNRQLFYKNDKNDYQCYFSDKNLLKGYIYCKDGQIEKKYKYKEWNQKGLLLITSFYINQVCISLEFNNAFYLLRYKDKLKSRIRKKCYYLIDHHILPNLTDITMSYIYNIYNVPRKYCLI